MSYLAWTLQGDRVAVFERYGGTYVPLQMGCGDHTVSARAAGLLSHLFRDRGDTELADLLWAARAAYCRTEAGRASQITEQPVWGLDAGPGICHGCDELCEHSERHYYCLPTVGTVALCLECGPEDRD